jgi:hypothetical protein
MTKEWSIRDEETGAWLQTPSTMGSEWGPTAHRWPSYDAAINAYYHKCGLPSARIVEAPPREMTDDEAWVWFSRRTRISLGALHVNDIFREWVVFQDSDRANIGRGPKPCDAIRAAAKKIGA